jgi:O-antigen/teichoic acid export membrane protein
MLVRLMPTSEYGFYTLILTGFTFICVFSDMGATEALSFFRWRAVKRNSSWSRYFYAVMRFRDKVFFIGFSLSAIYLYFTGGQIGESSQNLLMAIWLLGLSSWFALRTSIVSYSLKLVRRFRESYAIDLGNESVKLLVVAIASAFGMATAFSGLASILIGSIAAVLIANSFLKNVDFVADKPRMYGRQRASRILLRQIMPTMPGSLYFSFQGLIIGLLAASFGTVVNVAEIGALGRIGAIISVFAGFSSTVFVPKLLTITDERSFLGRYLIWWLVLIFVGVSMLLLALFFPQILLFLLGEQYSGLYEELLIVVATSVVGAWGGFAWNINRARGWVRFHVFSVLLTILCQVMMYFCFDLSSTSALLAFGFVSVLVGFIYQLGTNILGFLKMHLQGSFAD